MENKQELPEFIQGLATKKNQVLQRREIIKKEYLKLLDRLAKENVPIYSTAKPTGKQKNLEYVNIATLYYDFVDAEKWYLNFTVKLVLGIKNNGKHVQYSITKIDVIK